MSKVNKSSPTVSVSYLRVILNYCRAHGISEFDLCKEASVDPALLANSEERIPRKDSHEIFRAASRLMNDPDIGLHAGQQMQPGYFGAMGLSLMSAKTPEQALALGLRYQSLVADGLKMGIEVENELVKIILQPESNSVKFSKEGIDAFLSSFIKLARTAMGDELNPSWVSIKLEKPESIENYERIFKCPINFGAKQTILAFPFSLSARELLQANPEIIEIMTPVLEKQLRYFPDDHEEGWLTRARKYIASQLCHGYVHKDAIAEHLGISPRQLRRQLEQEGLNVTSLIEDTRSALAEQYIQEKDKSLLDITYLLGYKEQASFQKAFKQWTGYTPGDYRRYKLSQKNTAD